MAIRTKQEIQLEQQMLYLLSQIFESFPQYTQAQHLVHILRKKGDLKDVYFWDSQTLLSKIESYYDELKTDLVNEKEDY